MTWKHDTEIAPISKRQVEYNEREACDAKGCTVEEPELPFTITERSAYDHDGSCTMFRHACSVRHLALIVRDIGKADELEVEANAEGCALVVRALNTAAAVSP